MDFRSRTLSLELQLPIDRLEIGFGKSLVGNFGSIERYRAELAQYVRAHLLINTPSGTAWRLSVDTLFQGAAPHADELYVRLTATPPSGAPLHGFSMHYDVIQHQLITHEASLYLRSDWNDGKVNSAAQFVATIGYGAETVRYENDDSSLARGFASMIRLGIQHISEGTDHLLFLLTLLLPAALVARDGRWSGFAGVRKSTRRLLTIVTAFTAGHSITLALGALNVVHAPSEIVEVLVAISILISAVHAARPIFPGKEWLIAGGFGLVHGLAFATLVQGFGVDLQQTLLTVFGFNLGIEMMQLAVVVATVPWLLMLAYAQWEAPVRYTGASIASVAAVAWIAERAFGVRNAFEVVLTELGAHVVLVECVLASIAIIAAASVRGALLRPASTFSEVPHARS